MELNTDTSATEEAMVAYKEVEEKTGDEDMAVTTDTAGVLALLADTNRAGRGNGVWGSGGGEGGIGSMMFPGNSVLAAGAHADGTAVKTAVDCNAASSAAALDRVSAQNREDRFNNAIENVRTGQFQEALRNSDGQRDIEKLVAAGQAASALAACKAELCCKETQCLIKEENAETRALIVEKHAASDALALAIEGRSNLDKLAEARAEILALKCNPCHP